MSSPMTSMTDAPAATTEGSDATATAAAVIDNGISVIGVGTSTAGTGVGEYPTENSIVRTGNDDTTKEYHSVPASGDAAGVGLVTSSSFSSNRGAAAAAATATAKDGTEDDVEKNGSNNTSFQPLEQEPQQPPPPPSPPYYYNEMEDSEIVPPSSEVCEGWWRNLLHFFQINRSTLVRGCYLGMGAIAGTLLRIILAQLFGEECKNPGTVGWLKAASPLCVTANGSTGQVGGIIFADLPANLLGCFFMGLLQDGSSLGLAISTPIAWLHPSNIFQGYTILHLALKTGFCGSLTTFSSWNSEMVIMLVGKAATHRESQLWKALFGYIIGMETALGSYVFGRTVAFWFHKWKNPALAQEVLAIRERQRLGYVINKQLPSLERRFLPDLPLYLDNGEYPPSTTNTPGLVSLAEWRESTRNARRLEHASASKLQELETAIFANHQPITSAIESMCRNEGWNIDALQDYLRAQGPLWEEQMMMMTTTSKNNNLTATGICKPIDQAVMFQWPYATGLLVLIMALLVTLLATSSIENSYDITYRTMVYSMLCAPPGAIIRWRLGTLNGTFPKNKLQWIPSGTLLANWLGCIFSIAMIAAEYRLEENSLYYGFWTVATFRAIKIGFCGSLTTVSTYISEVHGMMSNWQPDRAYKYITLSLGGAAMLSTMIFALIVYTAPIY